MSTFNPSLSIMHISDIHRSPKAPMSNTVLLSALKADYGTLNSQIRPIDAIVCSGDIIQGLPIGDISYPDGIGKQYDEAYEFLAMLANHFLGGDRSKLVIVPGNHDVDWNIAKQAMGPITLSKNEGIKEILQLSGYRLNRDDLSIHKIKDYALYNRRLEKFCLFYKDFFSDFPAVCHSIGKTFEYSIQEITDGVIVAGFNSCEENDCFQDIGKISPDIIAKCHLEIERKYPEKKIKIAVWHHSFHGAPNTSDYMDRSTVELLLSKGFRLGLHGHQHQSEVIPYSKFYEEEQIMAVIGAGSLTASSNELPQGCNRQFNYIELDLQNRKARIHIRGMLSEGIFSADRRFMNGKTSDIEFTSDHTQRLVNANKNGGEKLRILDQIEKLVEGNPSKALEKINDHINILGEYGRKLKIKCLNKTEQWDELARCIGTPENSEEFGMLFESLCKIKKFNEAAKQICQALNNKLIEDIAEKEFKKRLFIKKRISLTT